jgi:hypothetical protein
MIAPSLVALCPWEMAGAMEAEPLDHALRLLRHGVPPAHQPCPENVKAPVAVISTKKQSKPTIEYSGSRAKSAWMVVCKNLG